MEEFYPMRCPQAGTVHEVCYAWRRLRPMTPLFLAACTLVGFAMPQDLVDNPEYQRWTAFAPGAWVKHRTITEDPSGKKEGESLVRLLEKKADRVVLHLAMALDL